MRNVLLIATLSLAVSIFGCEKAPDQPTAKDDSSPTASAPPANAKPITAKNDEHRHGGQDHAAQGQSAAPGGPSGHSGEVVALGTSKLGVFEVRASRDKVEFKPGGDAPIDVWIDGGVGKGVVAVRFWIGAQDAKGSIKAKAEIEDGRWHTHVEIPSPMPGESRLWVEIEESGGTKTVGSFVLGM